MKWFGHGRRQKKTNSQRTQTGLFGTLSERERRTVEGFMHKRHYLAGEVVFDVGEEGQGLYVINSGQVALLLPEQPDKPLASLQVDDYFGEFGLLDGWPRSAQARATEAADLSVLSRNDFDKLMESHARIASKIALTLARHLSANLRKMLANTPPDAVSS